MANGGYLKRPQVLLPERGQKRGHLEKQHFILTTLYF
jgi:hypothetical protein